MDVIFLDVGQGDAAIIHIPSRSGSKTILIDAGMKSRLSDRGKTVVLPVLKHLGINRIDLLVMSHPHDDHIGGVETVLSKVPVNEIWDTFSVYHSELYQKILDSVSEQSILYQQVGSGKWLADFSPVHIYILHPDSLYAMSEGKLNNVSLVMKLVYGGASFLFTGDVEEGGAREVITYDELSHTTVLKVAHHGSYSSTPKSFLDVVKPEYAVISVGERNIFKHPSEEVVKRIRESGIKLLRTDIEGAIWFKTNGRRIWKHNWK